MKFLKKFFIKNTKRIAKRFFEVCDVVTKRASLYKKVALLLLIVAAILGLFSYTTNRVSDTVSKTVVVSESEIIKRVAKFTSIPNEKPISIVRVEDAESLKEQHLFYKDVKEGDYVIVYEDRVIIYDLRGDRVVAQKFLQQ